MLFALLALALAESDECPEFKERPSIVDLLEQVATPTRPILGQIFGYEMNETVEVPTRIEDIDKTYIFSLCGFPVIFIGIFVVMVLGFLCHQVWAWCGCFRPKKTVKIGLTVAISHLGSVVVCMVAAALFFYAASGFTSTLKEAAKIPANVDDRLWHVLHTIDLTLDGTFKKVRFTVGELEDTMTAFTEKLKKDSSDNEEKAKNIKAKMDEYTGRFDLASDTEFKAQYRDLEDTLKQTVQAIVDAHQDTRKPVTDVAEKLIGGMASIGRTATKIDGTVNKELKNVKTKVDENENGNIQQTLKDVNNTVKDLVNLVKPVEGYIDDYDEYVNLMVYFGTAFLLLVAGIYGIFFFFNNGCSRCLAAWFPCFGVLLTIFLILPGSLFSAVWIVLNDFCPVLEDTAGNILGSFVKGNASDLLICPEPRPILDMLDIGFDYEKVVTDLVESATEALGADSIDFVDTTGLESDMGDFGGDFSVDNIRSDVLLPRWPEFMETAGEDVHAKEMDAIVNQADSEILSQVRDDMTSVLAFGRSVVPDTEALQTRVQNIVYTFGNESIQLIKNGVDTITCNEIKCIYAPVKNAVCIDMLNAISFWVLSTILMIIGVCLLEFNYCQRRKGMATPIVETEYDEYEEEDLEDFNHKRSRGRR